MNPIDSLFYEDSKISGNKNVMNIYGSDDSGFTGLRSRSEKTLLSDVFVDHPSHLRGHINGGVK